MNEMPDQGVVGQQNQLVSSASEAGIPISGAERRTAPRLAVDETVAIHPVAGAAKLAGKITDLSLGGCRLEVDTRYLTGAMLRVELQFEVNGVLFRLLGVTAGRRTPRSIGIRFVDLSERRKADLVEVIEEIQASVTRAKRKDAEKAPSVSGDISLVRNTVDNASAAISDRSLPRPGVAAPANAPSPGATQGNATRASATPSSSTSQTARAAPENAIAPAPTDRRAHRRHAVDTSAKLHLVKTGICMTGTIQDLSMAGCRLRTEEPFNVGIYVRVETEFYLRGLPFRLGGVSQAIMNKNTIGVRFLDMSDRKRDQLAELIDEISEHLAAVKSTEEPDVESTMQPPAESPSQS